MSTDTDVDPRMFSGGLLGYVSATWDELRRLGQESNHRDRDKTYSQWDLVFEDGTTAQIYDWKLSEPLGLHDSYRWHISGTDPAVVRYVNALVLALRHKPSAVSTSPVTYVQLSVPMVSDFVHVCECGAMHSASAHARQG